MDTSAGPAQGAGSVTFALRRIYFGDTPWDDLDLDAPGDDPVWKLFGHDPEAWKLFGFDIDGIVSTKCSRDHCFTSYGPSGGLDGPGGLDNLFGSSLIGDLDFIFFRSAPISKMTSETMEEGQATYLIRLERTDLSENANQIPAAFLTAGDRGSPPAWDSADVWPVTDDSVIDGDLAKPRVAFLDSYFVGDMWVAGPSDTAVIVLQMRGAGLLPRLRLHRPMLAMRITRNEAARSTARGFMTARGIIAGIIDPEELIADGLLILAAADNPLCNDLDYVNSVRNLVDVNLDGKDHDPTVPCTGISAGIGFDAELAQIGSVVPAPIEPTAPCP